MLASAIVVNVVIYSKFSKMRSAHYIYICTYIDYSIWSIMYYRRKGERKSGFSITRILFSLRLLEEGTYVKGHPLFIKLLYCRGVLSGITNTLYILYILYI